MAESKEAQNEALVLKAFDTLFNKRDYAAAERSGFCESLRRSRFRVVHLLRAIPSFTIRA
jgi:hypothetical protein